MCGDTEGSGRKKRRKRRKRKGRGYPGSQAGGDALREGPWDEMEKEKLASLRQDHAVPDPRVAGGDGDREEGRRARKSPGASDWATGQVRGAGGVALAAPSLQHPPSLAETALLLLNPKQSWVCRPHPSQGWVTGMGGTVPAGTTGCVLRPSPLTFLGTSQQNSARGRSGRDAKPASGTWAGKPSSGLGAAFPAHVLYRASMGEGCREL